MPVRVKVETQGEGGQLEGGPRVSTFGELPADSAEGADRRTPAELTALAKIRSHVVLPHQTQPKRQPDLLAGSGLNSMWVWRSVGLCNAPNHVWQSRINSPGELDDWEASRIR